MDAYFNKIIASIAIFLVGQIMVHVMKKWTDKIMGNNWGGDERRKNNSLVIDEHTIKSVVEAFQEHVQAMQKISGILECQRVTLDSNKNSVETLVGQSDHKLRLLKEIHAKTVLEA